MGKKNKKASCNHNYDRLVSSEEIFERYKDNLKTVFKEEE